MLTRGRRGSFDDLVYRTNGSIDAGVDIAFVERPAGRCELERPVAEFERTLVYDLERNIAELPVGRIENVETGPSSTKRTRNPSSSRYRDAVQPPIPLTGNEQS